jgi:hypothetical protein
MPPGTGLFPAVVQNYVSLPSPDTVLYIRRPGPPAIISTGYILEQDLQAGITTGRNMWLVHLLHEHLGGVD